jgi:hypothetical protein
MALRKTPYVQGPSEENGLMVGWELRQSCCVPVLSEFRDQLRPKKSPQLPVMRQLTNSYEHSVRLADIGRLSRKGAGG